MREGSNLLIVASINFRNYKNILYYTKYYMLDAIYFTCNNIYLQSAG